MKEAKHEVRKQIMEKIFRDCCSIESDRGKNHRKECGQNSNSMKRNTLTSQTKCEKNGERKKSQRKPNLSNLTDSEIRGMESLGKKEFRKVRLL